MPKVTIEVNIPQGRSVAEAEGAVKRHFDPEWIASWWHISDVHSCANGFDDDDAGILTDQEAAEVLRLAKKYHDSDEGINWSVLECWIDHVMEKRSHHTGDCPAKDGFGCNCKEAA